MESRQWAYVGLHTGLKCVCVLPPTAQRSAQELPLVEKQSMDSYPATGGKMMLLTGLNFLPDSKVVFVEKAQGKLPALNHVYLLSISPPNVSLERLSLSPPLPPSRFLSLSSRQNRAGLAREPHVVCIKPLYF